MVVIWIDYIICSQTNSSQNTVYNTGVAKLISGLPITCI